MRRSIRHRTAPRATDDRHALDRWAARAGRAFAFGFVGVATLASLSCGGQKPMAAVGIEHVDAQRRTVKRVAPRTQRLFTAAASDRLLGPFASRGNGKNLVVWVDNGEGGTRRVRGLATDDIGVPVEPIRELVPSAGDITSLTVARSGGESAAHVVAWTSLGSRGETLSLMGVGDDLSTRAPAVEVARSNDDIVWVEVVPGPRGAVVLWAEETHDGKANVLSMPVDAKGKPRGVPSFVIRGIVGWHVVPTDDGVALGMLGDAGRRRDATGYVLSVLRLDDDGRPKGATIPVVAEATVPPDFEMVRSGVRGVAFAWTDKSGLESEVKTTIVDDRDRVAPPRGLVSSLSGAKLLRLQALDKGALLAWEEPTQRARTARRVHLERLEGFESVSRTVLELEGKGPPEIAPLGEGAMILGRMRVCDKTESEEVCEKAPFAPAVVELDRNLVPGRAERVEYGDPAEAVQLAWSLSCAPNPRGARCMMLALGVPEKEAAQPVLAAPTFERTVSQRALVTPLHGPGRPRPRSLATVFRSEPVSEVAIGRAQGASLVAVLTRGEGEGAMARRAVKQARLYLVPIDKDGKHADAILLAPRASAGGGAAFTTAPDGSLALAWVSREDGGGARVHLTRMSVDGKKSTDVLVTTRKGEFADVNVAAVEGGFVVGWIDSRDGNGEVYAAKVTGDLSRVSEHQRLTNAPGDASDLTMVAHPSGVVWLAWTDPRESPREGNGDIYAIAVRAKDARKTSDETRLLATAAHSRSPSLAVTEAGVACGWIEEAPLGIDAESHAGYGAMLAWLDVRGHAVREPVKLRGAGRGAPVGITLEPGQGGTRGLLVRSGREELSLDAFIVEGSGRVVSSWLISPEGPPTLDLPIALDADAAIYAEESRGASEHKVRRMLISWP